jgi:hypothetical protein
MRRPDTIGAGEAGVKERGGGGGEGKGINLVLLLQLLRRLDRCVCRDVVGKSNASWDLNSAGGCGSMGPE